MDTLVFQIHYLEQLPLVFIRYSIGKMCQAIRTLHSYIFNTVGLLQKFESSWVSLQYNFFYLIFPRGNKCLIILDKGSANVPCLALCPALVCLILPSLTCLTLAPLTCLTLPPLPWLLFTRPDLLCCHALACLVLTYSRVCVCVNMSLRMYEWIYACMLPSKHLDAGRRLCQSKTLVCMVLLSLAPLSHTHLPVTQLHYGHHKTCGWRCRGDGGAEQEIGGLVA